ncbi:3'(2'),5'-bisphosphate nucleotidase CysQ [subsurface metagenome]
MVKNIDIQEINSIAKEAGNELMEIYQQDFNIKFKKDYSPLTKADLKSNEIITNRLKNLYPNIPILSEENESVSYNIRKNWEYFWLIDPLDGTKEFIKKNGEFTVNIALIHKDTPVLGVIYAPALNLLYYAQKDKGAFKQEKNKNPQRLPIFIHSNNNDILKIIVSKSHYNQETKEFVNNLKNQYKKDIEFIHIGSSLKFCLIAEGKADIYPRLAPTMEWDTAAGQIIVKEARGKVFKFNTQESLKYNKQNLLNPWFVTQRINIQQINGLMTYLRSGN